MYKCLHLTKQIMGENFLKEFKSEEIISIFGKVIQKEELQIIETLRFILFYLR
jgi:tyrosine-protein phosphatase YwqE